MGGFRSRLVGRPMKATFLSTMLAFLGVLLGTGCANVRPQAYRQMPPRKDRVAYQAAQAEMDGKPHGIWIPANTNVVIKPWQKLNPLWEIFGNADDPKPPQDYHTGMSVPMRHIMWWFRNPFHNLFFYGIGVADKDKVRFGKYPELMSNPNGGIDTAATAYKRLRLPYISLRVGRLDFYFGWRNRGNFGGKINFTKKKKEVDGESPPARPRHMKKAGAILLKMFSLHEVAAIAATGQGAWTAARTDAVSETAHREFSRSARRDF